VKLIKVYRIKIIIVVYYFNMEHEFPLLETTDSTDHIKEQIVYLYFNYTRKSNKEHIDSLRTSLCDVLQNIKKNINTDPNYMDYLKTIYKMIAQTRDIYEGKGEHELSYMSLYVLYQYFPSLSIYLLHRFVNPIPELNVPYGSWRDIKYLCEYVRGISPKKENDELIHVCVELMNKELKKDIESWKFSIYAGSRKHISNVSKWIPRENKHFGWLYNLLVFHWSENFSKWKLSPYVENPSYSMAVTKAKRQYRKVISYLNKKLDTTQIKQCSQKLDDLEPSKISCYTLMKQKLTFLGEREGSLFTEKFKTHCEDKYFYREPGYNANYFVNFPLSYFVKEAIRISQLMKNTDTSTLGFQYDLLNKQWEIVSNSIPSYHFKAILPILDTSFKMQENDSEGFYYSIGYSILISCKSLINKRILVIDNQPSWINFDDGSNFISMVETVVHKINSHQNTCYSYEKIGDIILNSIQQVEKPCTFIKNMKLVFFSNSFGDCNFYKQLENLFHNIEKPMIVLWNVSKNVIPLPTTFNEKGVIMLSGFSNTLLKSLNTINSHGVTPYTFIEHVVNEKRYTILDNYLASITSKFFSA